VTVATFCTSGQAERLKGGVHAVAGAIVGVMAVYNVVAWWYRREKHLGVNAAIYTVGFAFEAYQTSRHFRHSAPASVEVRATPALVVGAARISRKADPCQCGEGFCWCGRAETRVLGFEATGS
jgi:hypothetical protein